MNYKKNEASKVTSANEMTEELLTSRFGSHESVCKPDHQCGIVETEEDAICREASKITWARKNVYKVGVNEVDYLLTYSLSITLYYQIG